MHNTVHIGHPILEKWMELFHASLLVPTNDNMYIAFVWLSPWLQLPKYTITIMEERHLATHLFSVRKIMTSNDASAFISC